MELFETTHCSMRLILPLYIFSPRFLASKRHLQTTNETLLQVIFHPCLFAEVWPPESGRAFDTSILSWSFADQSFWRGSAIAMSEVVTFARSIASTRFREAMDENPNSLKYFLASTLIIFIVWVLRDHDIDSLGFGETLIFYFLVLASP